MNPVKIKICGIRRRDTAEFAAECGADYIGLVLAKQSPRFIPLSGLDRFAGFSAAAKVGVFVRPEPDFVREAVERAGLDVIQLHGNYTGDEISAFAVPGCEIWLAVNGVNSPDIFCPGHPANHPAVRRLVVDAEQPGSGKICDWNTAAALGTKREIFLAGGLNSSNIAAAIHAVKPFGVDISGGVEIAPGVKSNEKIKTLIKEIATL